MTDKDIDKIWKRVKRVMEEYHMRMDYGAAATIGGAFGELVDEIKRLQQEVEFWRNIAESCECNND
ncbi:hypothetical protein NST20_13100 [Weizmannia sp. FSL W8-0676]|uniref:hypothetical protein n=1 Tax=Heyndrickxia TaxID=2837504 RepID=UPI002235A23D|nr:hypothetical protein [Heyndrickxia coagulans]UZH06384.1 hypothetical protein ONG97_00110 [Heyndrickxia coagulans]UZH06438.1 hypothetical protein ONG97_00420 [Heyndrickxia coagulans]